MARDRLWQMEFQSIVADGRFYEIVGMRALDFDKFHRRIGIKFGAKYSLYAILNDKEQLGEINNYHICQKLMNIAVAKKNKHILMGGFQLPYSNKFYQVGPGNLLSKHDKKKILIFRLVPVDFYKKLQSGPDVHQNSLFSFPRIYF